MAFEEVDPAALKGRPAVEVVVDRVRSRTAPSRLTDSVETSYREGGGAAFAVVPARGTAAPERGRSFLGALRVPHLRHRLRDAAAPALLFQQPLRRVPTCNGFGNVVELDMQLGGARPFKTLDRRAPWSRGQAPLSHAPRGAETRRQEDEPRMDVPWQ